MDKKCSCCGSVKPRSEYQKRALSKDGLTSSCKACLGERDARRFKDDPRVRQRHRKYAKTDAGKASLHKSRVKWSSNNPEKRAAHIILGNAVRDGRVSKPCECQDCGSGGRIEGHHEDYAFPLSVEWLCRQCHVDRHK